MCICSSERRIKGKCRHWFRSEVETYYRKMFTIHHLLLETLGVSDIESLGIYVKT